MKHIERECAAGPQVTPDLAKAGELIRFREIVQERAVGNQDEREARLEREGAHVALHHVDALSHGVGSRCQLALESVEHDAARIQRPYLAAIVRNPERDAAGAGAELQHGPSARLGLGAIPGFIAMHAGVSGDVVDVGSVVHGESV